MISEAILVAALLFWIPTADPAIVAATAHAIAEVVNDSSEAVVFGSKEKDALVLASLASFEGGLSPWVFNGSCNDPTWRKAHRDLLAKTGDCDGGHAYTLWQIHTDSGISLTAAGWVSWVYAKPGSVRISGWDLVKDPTLAARAALHILRQGGILGYTGNQPAKADARMKRATDYMVTMPKGTE